MAGHTSEKRWRQGQNPNNPDQQGVSAQASELCSAVIGALTQAEAGYAEMQELYLYNGSTVQGLADQLFKEDYEARLEDGVDAVIEVDVQLGEVSNAVIITAGTGYTPGTYVVGLTITADGGDGLAELEYVVGSAGDIISATVLVGGSTYTSALGQTVIEIPAAGQVAGTQASTEEVNKTQDLFDAITALHELHLCANNTAVATEDRYAQMRRMT